MTNGNIASNRAVEARVTDRYVRLRLEDGREVSAPLSLYPSLAHASRQHRRQCELLPDGQIVHWPAIDLDLTTDQLVNGRPEKFPPPPPKPGAEHTQTRVEHAEDGWVVLQTRLVGRFSTKRQAQAARRSIANARESNRTEAEALAANREKKSKASRPKSGRPVRKVDL